MIFTAIATALGPTLGSLFTKAALEKFLIKTLAKVAVSAIVKKLTERKSTQVYGTNGKLQGGDDVPRQAPFGVGATEGSLVYASFWGNSGVPNSHLTQVIALSDLPIKGLLRVMIDGVYVTLDTVAASGEEDLGFPVIQYRVSGKNYAWVKFHDGTQTTADALLTGRGENPDYPWDATAIGVGVAYAVVTSRVNDELYSGFPKFKFELDSVRLYDPSRDSTVGGSGSQRWSNPATWGGDGDYLPVVQAYNILRGVRFNGQWVYGFQRLLSAQLPVSAWIAEINKCRVAVSIGSGNTEPRFRAGGILSFGAECGDALEAIMAAAAGRVMEIGGIYKPRVGVRPGISMNLADEQIITTEGQNYIPFKRLSDTINAVIAQYPEPKEGYSIKTAPPVYNATYEAEDGGRRLPSQITLENVPYPKQVQRIINIALREARRERRLTMVLPPSFYAIEPGDEIAYTSERHGFANKPFLVENLALREDCHVIVDLIEVDDSGLDFDAWEDYAETIEVPVTQLNVPAASLFDFAVSAGTIIDSAGASRRPRIIAEWTYPGDGTFTGVEIQVALAAFPTAITTYTTSGNQTEYSIIAGILPLTEYLVRGAPITRGTRQFTVWIPVTTTDTRISAADLAEDISEAINDAIADANAAGAAAAAAQAEIDALTAGFIGTLVDGFNEVDTDLTALEATQSSHAASIGGLNTSVTSILGCRADLLTGTALATLFTQLDVSSTTGLSAAITNQASAIADLEGNAAAMWGVKLTAGSASTSINFVAADNPTGPISTGTFEMNNLLIRANQVLVAPNNAFGDYDMMQPAAYFTTTGASYLFNSSSLQGVGYLHLTINASADLETVYTDWFAVEPSTEYLVRACAWTGANTVGSGTSTVSVQTGSLGITGTITTLTTTLIKTATDTLYSTSTASGEVVVMSDSTARRMRFKIDRAAGGTATGRSGGFMVTKRVGSSLIVDGGVEARHVETGALRADHIGSGLITAAFLKIDASMAVDDVDAGFSFGKTSPSDFATDGLYLGRTLTNAGATGFGFLLGNTSLGGYNQSIQHTTDAGLKITNANFAFNTGTYVEQTVTSSQTVTLPVGTTEISLSILGAGGGGGQYGTTYTSRGGTTTVQLWDGTTNTGISWSSTGGLNGGASSSNGAKSVLGTGGVPASGTWVGGDIEEWRYITSATAGTGYGAGGGGGATFGAGGSKQIGKGGGAASLKSVSKYDVSGLANPKLVITIGAAGSTGAAYAAAGSPGYVKINRGSIISVNANVLPLRPTASGTFTKAANATGSTVFPDLGPGMWIISGTNSELLCLDQLRITNTGPISVKGANARSMTFVADIRPNIIVGNATAVTIVYAFYSMKLVT